MLQILDGSQTIITKGAITVYNNLFFLRSPQQNKSQQNLSPLQFENDLTVNCSHAIHV